MTEMRALTIRQPWAWAVLYAGKDIENRSWLPPAHVMGVRIAIHAAKAHDRAAYEAFHELYGREAPEDLPRGVFVGTAIVAGWVDDMGACSHTDMRDYRNSRWFMGPIGWVMREPRPVERLVECAGALGIWRVPNEIHLAW